MSIDPDVEDELVEIRARLAALEASVVTPGERLFWKRLTAALEAGNSAIFDDLNAVFEDPTE